MTETRKRGRPKGSKNKPKEPTPETTIEIGMDGIALNEITSSIRTSFIFKAASCGCTIEKSIHGAGMFCKHRNAMILQK